MLTNAYLQIFSFFFFFFHYFVRGNCENEKRGHPTICFSRNCVTQNTTCIEERGSSRQKITGDAKNAKAMGKEIEPTTMLYPAIVLPIYAYEISFSDSRPIAIDDENFTLTRLSF